MMSKFSHMNPEYESLKNHVFQYLEERLKLDLERIIRKGRFQDKVFLSTRTKTFESFHKRLSRMDPRKNAIRLDDHNVRTLITDGTIEDVIGAKLVVFDDQIAKDIIHYIKAHSAFRKVGQKAYLSQHRNVLEDELATLLKIYNFDVKPPEGRPGLENRYEDIKFVVNLLPPGKNKQSRYGERRFGTSVEDARKMDDVRFKYINFLWSNLDPRDQLLTNDIRIEIQIQTIAMYAYNRAQRGNYEVFKNTNSPGSNVESDSGWFEPSLNASLLEALKGAMSAAGHTLDSLQRSKYGGFDFAVPMALRDNFSLRGRVPEWVSRNLREKLYELNDLALTLADRTDSSMADVTLGVQALRDRKNLKNLGGSSTLLGLPRAYPSGEDYGPVWDEVLDERRNLYFWQINRIILLVLCVIGLSARRLEDREQAAAYLRQNVEDAEDSDSARADFGETRKSRGDASSHTDNTSSSNNEQQLAKNDIEEAVGSAVFQALQYISEVDHEYVAYYLSKNGRKLNEDVCGLIDPIVQWRLASYHYRKERFENARDSIVRGRGVLERRDDLDLEVAEFCPTHLQFDTRRFEYTFLDGLSGLSAPAGPGFAKSALEDFQNVFEHHRPVLTSAMDRPPRRERDVICRCWAYKCLLSFFLISAASRYPNIDVKDISVECYRDIAEFKRWKDQLDDHPTGKVWWELACGIAEGIYGEPADCKAHMKACRDKLEQVNWHPPTVKFWWKRLLQDALVLGATEEDFPDRHVDVRGSNETGRFEQATHSEMGNILQQAREIAEVLREMREQASSARMEMTNAGDVTSEQRMQRVTKLWNDVMSRMATHHYLWSIFEKMM